MPVTEPGQSDPVWDTLAAGRGRRRAGARNLTCASVRVRAVRAMLTLRPHRQEARR